MQKLIGEHVSEFSRRLGKIEERTALINDQVNAVLAHLWARDIQRASKGALALNAVVSIAMTPVSLIIGLCSRQRNWPKPFSITVLGKLLLDIRDMITLGGLTRKMSRYLLVHEPRTLGSMTDDRFTYIVSTRMGLSSSGESDAFSYLVDFASPNKLVVIQKLIDQYWDSCLTQSNFWQERRNECHMPGFEGYIGT